MSLIDKLKKWWNPHYPYKIGYKICRISSGGIYRSSHEYINSVTYELNKTTFPPVNHGPLFIFSGLRSANWFHKHCCINFPSKDNPANFVLLKCKYLPSERVEECYVIGKKFAEEVIPIELVKKY